MLRIGICDDLTASRMALRSALERLSSGCTFYEFSSGEGLLRWLEHHPNAIDVLFLDIEMHGLSGMETAHAIRQQDQQLLIVFLTGYADYVFDGYAVRAFDYLLKPLQPERLAALLSRIARELTARAPAFFTVRNTEGLFRIPKTEILYFYSERRLVYLVTANAQYPFYDKLDRVTAEAGDDFLRIHQRYLVRLSAIDRVAENTVFIGSARLPVSRANWAAVLSACARGLLEEM